MLKATPTADLVHESEEAGHGYVTADQLLDLRKHCFCVLMVEENGQLESCNDYINLVCLCAGSFRT